MDSPLLKSAKQGRKIRGQKNMITHLEGKRLTQREAIAAKCYGCNGMGEFKTCEDDECPLLPYSPYSLNQIKCRSNAALRGFKPKKAIVETAAKEE